MVSIVVSMANNRVVGRDNLIPWRVRSDLGRLKRLTAGNVVILGRKTYESMDQYYTGSGRAMPGQLYLVVTRDQAYHPLRDNARAVHSVPEALDEARSINGNVFVIGGAQIYAEALPLADRIYLTQVKADVDGDTYFPELDPQVWRTVEREDREADEKNQYPFAFMTLDRVV